MKKKITLTPATFVVLGLLVVLVVYFFAFFTPAQAELATLRADISLANAQSATYQQYLTDSSSLEADIAAIQAEIDELNETGYTNDSNVSLVISDAIQRYRISLTSVSLDSVTTYEEHRALPINLTMSGDMNDILKFISHFENNEDGSYLVRAASMQTNGTTTTANLLIYLCTPNV